MSNGFLIGPDLLGKIRRVTDTVDGMPTSTGITRIPTRLQDLPRGGGAAIRLAYWTATASWFSVNPTSATSASNTKKIQFAFPTAADQTATAMCINHMAFLPAISTSTLVATRLILTIKEAGEWRLIGAAS
jgi:hypothetical protein